MGGPGRRSPWAAKQTSTPSTPRRASTTATAAAACLQLVAWAPDTSVVLGVAPDGAVHSSTDGGRTWQEKGRVDGAPEALGVNGDGVYIAVDGAIVASTDGGATFRTLYRGD